MTNVPSTYLSGYCPSGRNPDRMVGWGAPESDPDPGECIVVAGVVAFFITAGVEEVPVVLSSVESSVVVVDDDPSIVKDEA